MATYEFKVFLDRPPLDSDYDKLFAAGLDDAVPGTQNGRGSLDVARAAPNLADAIVSVATDLEKAGFSLSGIEETDLVSLRTVATRTERSYESVRLLAQGKRGPGNFPLPLSGDGWALYSWADVGSWFSNAYGTTVDDNEHDRIIAAAAHLLRARALVPSEPLSALLALAHNAPATSPSQVGSPLQQPDSTRVDRSAKK